MDDLEVIAALPPGGGACKTSGGNAGQRNGFSHRLLPSLKRRVWHSRYQAEHGNKKPGPLLRPGFC
jgi:hypothetical protein